MSLSGAEHAVGNDDGDRHGDADRDDHGDTHVAHEHDDADIQHDGHVDGVRLGGRHPVDPRDGNADAGEHAIGFVDDERRADDVGGACGQPRHGAVPALRRARGHHRSIFRLRTHPVTSGVPPTTHLRSERVRPSCHPNAAPRATPRDSRFLPQTSASTPSNTMTATLTATSTPSVTASASSSTGFSTSATSSASVTATQTPSASPISYTIGFTVTLDGVTEETILFDLGVLRIAIACTAGVPQANVTIVNVTDSVGDTASESDLEAVNAIAADCPPSRRRALRALRAGRGLQTTTSTTATFVVFVQPGPSASDTTASANNAASVITALSAPAEGAELASLFVGAGVTGVTVSPPTVTQFGGVETPGGGGSSSSSSNATALGVGLGVGLGGGLLIIAAVLYCMCVVRKAPAKTPVTSAAAPAAGAPVAASSTGSASPAVGAAAADTSAPFNISNPMRAL